MMLLLVVIGITIRAKEPFQAHVLSHLQNFQVLSVFETVIPLGVQIGN